ncbi:ATP-grasp domain-containing protein [Cumulibacter soli]|uniref:ATP-grasp domain-containing protein n=1 Tax=Cumulibacter soli TaxID=2546344 RepID=UPI001067C489|nr:ATP-grasp domain-containing protein [Cumulibacter soli]
MKILLTDGSSLASRQTAGLLHAGGHRVDTLGGTGFGLAAMTRAIGTRYRITPYGRDPITWVQEALRIAQDGEYDVLLPTQEQAAALSACADLVEDSGVRTVVPPFAALRKLQDKVSAAATLAEFGVDTPATHIVTAEGIQTWDRFPIYAKQPVATGSTGVVLARNRAELPSIASGEELVMQQPTAGQLVMAQSVWRHGELVAAHANERLAEGSGGGASRKRSLARDDVLAPLHRIGSELRWHGALCADLILTSDGPLVIDVNPRLVEPANAAASGVDLLGALMAAAFDQAAPQPASIPEVRTHQLLLALTGAADSGSSRRRIAAEAVNGVLRRGPYRGSREELTPVRGGEWRSAALLAAITATLIARPSAWRSLTNDTVSSYALSPEGWAALVDYASECDRT